MYEHTNIVEREDLLLPCSIKYYEYIVDHRASVKEAWEWFQLIAQEELNRDTCSILDYETSNHDKSKFHYKEFHGYRQWFYPQDKLATLSEDIFLKAWRTHVLLNDHHWEHWVVISGGKPVPLEMENTALIHMLLDWEAMSMNFGDTVEEFYSKKGDSMLLHPTTRKEVERLIAAYFQRGK